MEEKKLKLAEVVDLPCVTSLELDPDKVLNAAVGALDEVFVIGRDKDGELYYASSHSDLFRLLKLLRHTEQLLLDIDL